MKYVFLLLLFFGAIVARAQDTMAPSPELSNDEVYNTAGIEVKPEFPGGMQEFYKYISKNYRVPNVKDLAGKVFVSFIIEKDGSISEVKVLRDIGHGTGAEAKRVLLNCPKWIPGEQDGKFVRVLYSLPINITTRR